MALELSAPARRGAVKVTADRTLAWSEWGAPDGKPILFSPGAATSGSLGLIAGVVEDRGARLIAIDRPGLGRSGPSPTRTLLDTAEDIRAIGLDLPAMIGFSQGAPLALACAASGVVSAVAIVSGTDELAGPAINALLPPPIQQLVALATSDPPAAEAMFRGMMTPAALKEMLRGSPDVDLAIYLDPNFAAAFATAVDEAYVQGPDGYGRDTLLVMQRWPFDPAKIRVPAQLWYGSLDASPFHSMDHGASLASRIPGAKRTVVEGGGGSILWTHGAEIVENLLAARH